MIIWAVVAALLGAVCLAVGSERQSSGVRQYAGVTVLRPLDYIKLVRQGRWLVGGLLLLLGMALNVYALATAPLTVVQPIGAVAVVITTVLHARIAALKLNRSTIIAIACCVGGSAGFVALAIAATRENHRPLLDQENLTNWIAIAVIFVFAITAAILRSHPSAFLYIMGAGVLFAFVAVSTRLAILHVLDRDAGGFMGIPWLQLAVLITAALLGSYFVQRAHQHGPPDLVVAGLTVVDPLVAVVIGIFVLGELQDGVSLFVLAGMVVAAAVASGGVLVLARDHPDVIKRKVEWDQAAQPESPKQTAP
ncbi:DMT family transporter [Citricoccus sp. NR2]|uniref:DMT family transporter n=1 Tax=Citricoccus sp. NR2 TaxID=3004095 RepID=UPI0022DDA793|nr:DMT family transporter [Citricoccus sp. NR2]WBL18742.1 DMT family transporter [Citricoccus sp. NR2]